MTRLATAHHVVMVDDNAGDIYIAEYCFRRSKVSNPWLAFTSGPDFLAYLARVQSSEAPMPALVLLDINMPQMSGLDVLRETRANPFFADLPVFCMLTSSSDPRDEATARELGASGFATKPGTTEEYVALFDSFVSSL